MEWLVVILTSEPKKKKNISQEDLETESKLTYVATTRSNQQLIQI